MIKIKRPAGQGRADEAETTFNLSARVLALQQRPQPMAEEANVDVEGFKALLPERWFEAKYIGHATTVIFKTPKVFLHFEITELGEYKGTRVFRAFRVRRLKGRAAESGGFALHAGGELYATLVRLLGIRNRADRISLRPLRNMLFKIRLRSVTTDYKQRPLPEQNRYSTIDEIQRGE